MYAVIGRVRIHPGHGGERQAMITSGVIGMVRALAGSSGGYWSRSVSDGDLTQHSFWLFDTEDNAQAAAEVFGGLRNMPDAPASFLSVDVCEVIGQA